MINSALQKEYSDSAIGKGVDLFLQYCNSSVQDDEGLMQTRDSGKTEKVIFDTGVESMGLNN